MTNIIIYRPKKSKYYILGIFRFSISVSIFDVVDEFQMLLRNFEFERFNFEFFWWGMICQEFIHPKIQIMYTKKVHGRTSLGHSTMSRNLKPFIVLSAAWLLRSKRVVYLKISTRCIIHPSLCRKVNFSPKCMEICYLQFQATEKDVRLRII